MPKAEQQFDKSFEHETCAIAEYRRCAAVMSIVAIMYKHVGQAERRLYPGGEEFESES